MKNSASNLSTIQAIKLTLRRQAEELLPKLNTVLTKLGYYEIAHQRISQQNNDQKQQLKTTSYQGLTRALHSQFGCVMIKWELSQHSNHELSTLQTEVAVLNAVSILQLTEAQNIPQTIVPPVLAFETVYMEFLEQIWQLNLLAMPYYENGSLAQQLSNEEYSSLSDKTKQQLINQIAHLIANIHRAGWLHNDIKPSNVLLDNFLPNSADNSIIMPSLLLTDFALAENIDKPSVANPAGTPAYLAPECWQGQGATVQSDIYAFGIMLYEVLTGNRPFQLNSQSCEPLKNWAIQHCQQSIPTLPPEYQGYQRIINKALAKRVERRYRNMSEILEDLESV
ncbi:MULTISPECIES: serine/threonine-protein kinase [unclassified Psychrobacter]|uniref:serine/threonine-protein kinase n=1 Tax=unclassified Psychrobacter TaxID=196806 RepID=UPI00071E91BA|nr:MULTISPECIES: serine/threonine-protein kinase [unclassified Psychrobacter]OLF39400.1 serine/threonine protein kinase [Psychrobacter sp. Cmf 22.2]